MWLFRSQQRSAVAEVGRQFWKREEGKRPPLENVTIGFVKIDIGDDLNKGPNELCAL
jgi:hypothetical protein